MQAKRNKTRFITNIKVLGAQYPFLRVRGHPDVTLLRSLKTFQLQLPRKQTPKESLSHAQAILRDQSLCEMVTFLSLCMYFVDFGNLGRWRSLDPFEACGVSRDQGDASCNTPSNPV